MTTFVDLYFGIGLTVDRDEIQAAIEEDLGAQVDVVGAGTGAAGSNLDLGISEDVDLALATLARTLTRLGVPEDALVAISDPAEKVTLAELRQRWPASRDIGRR